MQRMKVLPRAVLNMAALDIHLHAALDLFFVLAKFMEVSPPMFCHSVLEGGHTLITAALKRTVRTMLTVSAAMLIRGRPPTGTGGVLLPAVNGRLPVPVLLSPSVSQSGSQ